MAENEKQGAALAAEQAEPDETGDPQHQRAQREQLKEASRQEFRQREEPYVLPEGEPVSEYIKRDEVDATRHLPDGGDVSQHARRPVGFDESERRAADAREQAAKASDKARRAASRK